MLVDNTIDTTSKETDLDDHQSKTTKKNIRSRTQGFESEQNNDELPFLIATTILYNNRVNFLKKIVSIVSYFSHCSAIKPSPRRVVAVRSCRDDMLSRDQFSR